MFRALAFLSYVFFFIFFFFSGSDFHRSVGHVFWEGDLNYLFGYCQRLMCSIHARMEDDFSYLPVALLFYYFFFFFFNICSAVCGARSLCARTIRACCCWWRWWPLSVQFSVMFFSFRFRHTSIRQWYCFAIIYVLLHEWTQYSTRRSTRQFLCRKKI